MLCVAAELGDAVAEETTHGIVVVVGGVVDVDGVVDVVDVGVDVVVVDAGVVVVGTAGNVAAGFFCDVSTLMIRPST